MYCVFPLLCLGIFHALMSAVVCSRTDCTRIDSVNLQAVQACLVNEFQRVLQGFMCIRSAHAAHGSPASAETFITAARRLHHIRAKQHSFLVGIIAERFIFCNIGCGSIFYIDPGAKGKQYHIKSCIVRLVNSLLDRCIVRADNMVN